VRAGVRSFSPPDSARARRPKRGCGNGYNRGVLKRILIAFLAATLGVAQTTPQAAQTLLVLPFENAAKAPGLAWIAEAFPEVLGQRMASPSLYVISREDRNYAFDRAGIPVNLNLSRATLFRIAEQMDADYMVLGRYTYDGSTFSATAQVLDVKKLHLSPELTETGPLVNLIEVQSALAWDLLRAIRPETSVTRGEFLAGTPPVRLDAFENYIRGLTATTRQEKIAKFHEAVRLNPNYTLAMLQLGRTYFAGREYESAASWLARVPRSHPAAREASFYAGLAYYYLGDFERAANAFSFLASRLPLTEVYNNLGVVEGRRGRRTALEYFQKAVDADPNDADYHFNLALALYRTGDMAAAARQLRETITLRPSDAEAKSLLETVNGNGKPADTAHARTPLERIKRNYDETSFRQLALEVHNATEQRLAKADAKEHAAYHVEHGRELLAQGFNLEAAQDFREAIQLDPTSAAAHAGLAAVAAGNNDGDTARKEANTALRLQPVADAYVVLAQLDLHDNKPEAAQENVKRALGLEPTHAGALQLKRTIASRLADKAR
jgi:tetratricopeptide (TPR) repeat protein